MTYVSKKMTLKGIEQKARQPYTVPLKRKELLHGAISIFPEKPVINLQKRHVSENFQDFIDQEKEKQIVIQAMS